MSLSRFALTATRAVLGRAIAPHARTLTTSAMQPRALAVVAGGVALRSTTVQCSTRMQQQQQHVRFASSSGGHQRQQQQQSQEMSSALLGVTAAAMLVSGGLLVYNMTVERSGILEDLEVARAADAASKAASKAAETTSTTTPTPATSESKTTTDATTTADEPAAAPAAETAVAPASTPAASSSTTPTPGSPDDLAVPYLIIGGGTAAFAAMKAIRERQPDAKVLIISEEADSPYMRTPLSKEMWFSNADLVDQLKFTDWNGRETALHYREPAFYVAPEVLLEQTKGATALILGQQVTHLDVYRRFVLLADGRKIAFDKVLLATGGQPKNLPIFANDASFAGNVTLFRKIADFKHLQSIVDSGKTVAIIGGGFLGSELACAISAQGSATGSRVVQIFPESGNMARVFPEYLSNWTTARLKELGVEVMDSKTVTSATTADGKITLSLTDAASQAPAGQVTVDHVVVAVGLEPNTGLAKQAGLEIDTVRGGILVNAELEARTNVWAAGDVSSFHDIALGRRRVEHHDHAVVSGRLAGENMTGARKPYQHQSQFWSDLGPKIGYEAIGIVDSSLETVSIWAKASAADTPQAAGVNTPDNASAADRTAEASASAAAAVASPVPAVVQPSTSNENDYGKGVVFYLRENKVVGILLWNIFGQIPTARRIIRDAREVTNPQDLARLFSLHSTKDH
ncbi:programmed cell death protein 8 [Capsaspora owczarzaki ATCC 30864]|uniref:Programmed cell death protein 8 n=1 Tax=Capsaspora owczarzaki (strain ATCC 30864) TaxID=595528 RepID=A0A0D2X3F5_CAPO3|nr:programmed cell death protein 8 [Capsaspora owczarzaki ATCC 30864]KJE94219.1 programmed cell death protein 8 [Capsaspora owczarzaki ATCC 30864]|eukprot:XP_004347647.1 programmed cell death protein 8 [Capsaspora owczarzaki ATCC 30864]